MPAPAVLTGSSSSSPRTSSSSSRSSTHARRAVPAALLTALSLVVATPALAQTASPSPTPAPTTSPAPATPQPGDVTIGVRQASGVYTFTGTVSPAAAGVQVTIARLGTDGRVTGVASTATVAGGDYEIRTSLPVGFASYYALTAPTAERQAARSRLYGLLVNVRPGSPVTPTVSLEVRRGTDSYVFSGFVDPARRVPITLARVVDGRHVGVIGSGRPSSAYAFGVPLPPGTYFFQVLTGAADGLAAGRSRVYGLVVPPSSNARPVAITPVHGGTAFGVYLVLAADAADPRLVAAAASARRLGYTAVTTSLGCDQGAARGLGRAASSQELATAVYFRTEADARRFAALHPSVEAGVVQVRTSCLD